RAGLVGLDLVGDLERSVDAIGVGAVEQRLEPRALGEVAVRDEAGLVLLERLAELLEARLEALVVAQRDRELRFLLQPRDRLGLLLFGPPEPGATAADAEHQHDEQEDERAPRRAAPAPIGPEIEVCVG